MGKSKIGVRFDGIETIQKIIPNNSSIINHKSNFSFDITVQYGIDNQKELIVAFVKSDIKISSKGGDTDLNIASITIGCGFIIDGFNQVVINKTDKHVQIDKNLDIKLRDISISTLRGIMYSEFRGTSLHKAILPIIDIESMVIGKDSII